MGCICSGIGQQKARHIDRNVADAPDNGVVGPVGGASFAGDAGVAGHGEASGDGHPKLRLDRGASVGRKISHSTMTNNEQAVSGQQQQQQQNNNITSNSRNHKQFVSFLSKLMQGRRGFQSSVRIEACDEFGNKTSVRRSGGSQSRLHNQSKRKSHSSESSGCGGSQVSYAGASNQVSGSLLVPPPPTARARVKKRKSVAVGRASDERRGGTMHADTASESNDRVANASVVTSLERSKSVDYSSDLETPVVESPVKESTEDSNTNADSRANREVDIQLFTSAQQLCYQIIKEKLLAEIQKSSDNRDREGRLLCLFLFGIQGSSKGEIAFDLVDHSTLSLSLRKSEEYSDESESDGDSDCPLYHYLDVAGLVVAHLDERIHQYNELVAETLRQRKRQLAMQNVEDGGNESNRDNQESSSSDSDDIEGDERRNDSRNPSIASQKSTSIDGQSVQSGDSFGLVTLSTKKRSILQLKLMKFYNSITIKWIFDLIEQEIEKLESRVSLCKCLATRDRVYCINLVPDQLSLFKSCLYLQQNLPLKDFRYPHWAVKFERRTNIKLVNKEKASEGAISTDRSTSPQNSLRKPLKIYNFRVPRLYLQHLDFTKTQDPSVLKSTSRIPTAKSEKRDNIEGTIVMATEVITNGLNEKLGPKYNEYFIQQFKALNRLVRLRYNPLRNYNYAIDDFDCCYSDESRSKQSLCCSKLWSQEQAEAEDTADNNFLFPRSADSILSSSMQNLLRDDDDETHASQKEPRLSLTCEKFHSNDSTGKLTPSSAGLNSLPSSVTSLVSSEGSTFAESRQEHSRRLIGTRHNNGHRFIKWAVELELVKSSKHKDNQGVKIITEDDGLDPSEGRKPLVSQTSYEPPEALSRASTRSPLMFAQQTKYSSSYQLTPIFVAYANGQAQLMFEAKREHQRTLKLRSFPDLQRLFKLILKAENQLVKDCEEWLYASILKHHPELEHSGTGVASKALPGSRRRRSMAPSSPSPLDSGSKSPTLIVYTIKVDIQRLQAGRFKFPSNFEFDLPLSTPSTTRADLGDASSPKKLSGRRVPILTVNSNLTSERAASSLSLPQEGGVPSRPQSANPGISGTVPPIHSKLRPSSSRATTGQVLVTKPKRHVQFKLNQAPIFDSPSKMKNQQLVQKRKWIRDTLFTSCVDESISDLLNPVASLVKISLTEANNNTSERLLKYDDSD